jgi:hypothetical protein
MDIRVFNAAVLIGWLLVLVGGVLIHPGAGLLSAGLLMLVLVFVTARMAGGIYAQTGDGEAD